MRDEETQERKARREERRRRRREEKMERWRARFANDGRRVVSKCTVMAIPDLRQPVNRCRIIP
jgi:hypothetical protein